MLTNADIQFAEPVPAPTPMAEPMLPRPFRVTRAVRETHDTYTLTLVPADGGEVPAFAPGQFNMLYGFGVGEVPISISGDPDDRTALVHTIRNVGPVTDALCKVHRDDIIGVRGPYGTAWPVERVVGDDIVLVAGGLGLAPLRPAFYQVLARRRDYRHVFLIYGARSPADLLYRRELERWRGQFGLQVMVTVDAAAEDWFGPVGVVTRLLARASFEPADTTALVCGPEVMMRFAVRDLMQRGLSPDDIYVSYERNMKCGIGLCGHCQLGPLFMCKDGAVFSYRAVEPFAKVREL